MKSKMYSPPLSSEDFYKDEEPTQMSFSSLPNSPSSSGHVLSPVTTKGNHSPGLVITSSSTLSPTILKNDVNAATTQKKGMLSKVFGRRKTISTTTTMIEQRAQNLTRNLSSKALDRLQASEQQFGIAASRTTPTCSDLSGESSGAAEVVQSPKAPTSYFSTQQKTKSPTINTSTKKKNNAIPPFRRGNITLERIPNMPPLQIPVWVQPARVQISPKRRASVHFGEDSFSLIESPRLPAAGSAFAHGLKPPPLMFQESDKKLPAVKSPPTSALKSPPPPALKSPPTPEMARVESADTTELSPEDLLFEIEPGHSLLLRGRKKETKNYIHEGKDICTQECVCCEGMIHCVGDASFLLCPFCRVVQPLLLTSSEREAYGLALGFSSQEWIEMSMED